MKIIAIIGARPQFIKHYPFEIEASKYFNLITVHTGQHYDSNMSEIFFSQLQMKKPQYMLSAGGGKHGEQTAEMILEIEKIVEHENPNGIVVYGDTNSTLAGAIVAAKLHIPIFHIEAGLRSFNREMPEEVNRVLTDHVSSLLFCPSEIAVENLMNEGIKNGVFFVGDIMKDLVNLVIDKKVVGIESSLQTPYYYVTIHRPYNTDDKERLEHILNSLNSIDFKIVMSLHPRTKNLMEKYLILRENYPNIFFIEPQSYFSNLNYLFFSSGLITDSGGMQKEAYWLQKKCITIRKETEWLETLESKANHLVFADLKDIKDLLKETPKHWNESMYGNGTTANQIVKIISDYIQNK